MNKTENYARAVSCYASDTAGVCSALYELGGMTVVHDASGCNSTYTTHDEPRWYDKESMIFISALTEEDMIFGNDEKFISDVCETAEKLQPDFIAVCGSPMPAMTGFDYNFSAEEIENRTKITTIGIETNGIDSYITGESKALVKLAERVCKDTQKTAKPSANILGMTPLDFSPNGSEKSIVKFLDDSGFETVCCGTMGTDLNEFSEMGSAWVNLVVSQGGLALAEYLEKRFDIPFVTAVPTGKKLGGLVAENLEKAYRKNENIFLCGNRKPTESDFVIVGESVFSSSLALALFLEKGIYANVICPLETDRRLLCESDRICTCEKKIAQEFSKSDIVVADGLYKPVCPENVSFFNLPHIAFSGRCFEKLWENMIWENFRL